MHFKFLQCDRDFRAALLATFLINDSVILIWWIFLIAVVLDTNKWFHQTDIEGKELSITIGSEYD